MKKLVLAFLCFGSTWALSQPALKTENIIVITFDGVRWQEIFGGADSILINDSIYTDEIKVTKEKFWAATANERRKKLFPFLWNTVLTQGQLYGNRNYDNNMNNVNPHWFSYPGYNEIFTGYADTAVNSNDKKPNKNENVLEFLNKQNKFKNKVAAFASWDVFDAIFNEERSGFLVSSGFDALPQKIVTTPALKLLNEMQLHSPRPFGNSVRTDFVTYYLAKEYLKAHQPKILYIGFDETDEYAHQGKYDFYLDAARLTDDWIADLWNYIQTSPVYKNKTTLLITTDHGRGDEKKSNWRHHGANIPDAYQIWMAAIGPDTKPSGEVKRPMQLYQEQIASTIAALLGFNFTANHPVAKPITQVYSK